MLADWQLGQVRRRSDDEERQDLWKVNAQYRRLSGSTSMSRSAMQPSARPSSKELTKSPLRLCPADRRGEAHCQRRGGEALTHDANRAAFSSHRGQWLPSGRNMSPAPLIFAFLSAPAVEETAAMARTEPVGL